MRSLISALLMSPLAAIVLPGCSTELGRLNFADVGSAETELTLDSRKEVDFWTDLDLILDEDTSLARSIMADADVSLAYSIFLYQGGELIKRVSCDPFDVSSFDIPTKFKSVLRYGSLVRADTSAR